MLTRRDAGKLIAGAAVSTTLSGAGLGAARAAEEKVIKIGVNVPITGADAPQAILIMDGALLGIKHANATNALAGYKLVPWVLNGATSTAGQYDPVQSATNARKFVADPKVLAAIGPMVSGSGKAMAPIFSEADLATITPSSTNPDITNPKFAAEFDPSGKAIYFRTVTTDAYQGPAMANFFYDVLKARSIYVLDDSGAYGVGLADAFEGRAREKGMHVLGRDRLDPLQPNYTISLTKIKARNPDALYYGGLMQAGAKLVKQAYGILGEKMPKGGGDGLFDPNMLTAVGFPAAEGWYCTIAAPHLSEDPRLQPWVKEFGATYHTEPNDYSITAYDAALVITNALNMVVKSGQKLTRANVRDAIQDSHTDTLQGPVSFNRYGDIAQHIISIFQVQKNTAYKLTDFLHQYKYIGVAPTT